MSASGEVAIVGSGLAGFTAYLTLRRELEPEQIAVFGTGADPAAAFRRRAEAIRQRQMRSESDGHCGPTSFPGLALASARRRRSLAPLLETVVDRYHPTLAEFLDDVRRLRERSSWDESLRRARVEHVRAVDGGFELDGHGVFRHVLLALGYPGLNMPAELRDDPRAVHAYEPHEYASTVTVVGAGLAAATEWVNAIAAGAEVVSVRRHEPVRRPLNVPRPYFSRRGLAGFHRLGPSERVPRLRALLVPSYPPGPVFDEPLAAAAAEGRFRIEPSVNGSEQSKRSRLAAGGLPAAASGRPVGSAGRSSRIAEVICATGFLRGFEHEPLLARLAAEHGLETAEGWIVLAPDSTVPALTDERRTLALAGVAAQWAFPAADSIAGAKYAAHGFLARIRSCRTR